MRRRASSSLVLLLALVLCAACPAPASPAASPTAVGAAGTACEYNGARFVPLAGWKVEEHRLPGEPLSRISIAGQIGSHATLVSIIPREMRTSGEPTRDSQTQQYFQGLRSSFGTRWTDIREDTFVAPARRYPVLFSRERVSGALPLLHRVHDNVILLYFPDDFPAGRYYYVFFWTDIHAEGDQPNSLTELRTLVDSFEIRSSPVGAPSRGCA
jgi:hypothetical protein